MRFLMFAASARQDSVNRKLIELAASMIVSAGHHVDYAHFSEFDVPLYHGDINAEKGIPDNAKKLITRMHEADAVIISSPEYNFSTPGTLKNLIDWVSRETPMPWTNQVILLMSASPALAGGVRGLWHTRVPLEGCGAIVYPNMFSLAGAYSAFKEDGTLQDASLMQRLKELLDEFSSFAERLKISN